MALAAGPVLVLTVIMKPMAVVAVDTPVVAVATLALGPAVAAEITGVVYIPRQA